MVRAQVGRPHHTLGRQTPASFDRVESEKECRMTSFRTANLQSTRDLRLTAELISLVARKVEDGGPAPGVVVHDDADYEASLQALLAAGPWLGQDVWVFAYGSLLWNPAFE